MVNSLQIRFGRNSFDDSASARTELAFLRGAYFYRGGQGVFSALARVAETAHPVDVWGIAELSKIALYAGHADIALVPNFTRYILSVCLSVGLR